MTFLLRTTIIAILLPAILSSYAQFPFSRHYTVNDGLPGSEILDISQDNHGLIWFATTYGPCSFNGYEFKSYTIPEIPDQSFILIQKGKDNRLWFLSYTGYLCFLEDGEIKPFQWNDRIQELAGKDFLHSIKVDREDRIWFKGKGKNQIHCISGNSILSSDTLKQKYTWQPSVFYNFFSQDDQETQDETLFKVYQKIAYPQLRPEGEFYKTQRGIYKILQNNRLVLIDEKEVPGNSKINNVDIYEEANGNIWLRKDLKGALFYPAGDLSHPLVYLADKRLTRIMKDREGNYWFTTEGEGVYLVPSFRFRVFPHSGMGIPGDNIVAFDFHHDRIIFSTNDNKAYRAVIRQGRITNVRAIIDDDLNLYGRDILWQSSGPVWVIQSDYLRYDPSGNPMPLNMVILHKPYEAVELNDGSVAVATIQGFYIYKDGILVYDSRKDMFLEHIQTIFQDEQGTLWLGTVSGLYSFSHGQYTDWGEKYPVLSRRMSKIDGSGNQIWIGTRENGIAIIGNASIRFLTAQHGLNSNVIKSMFITDTVAWIGTNKGLNRVIPENGSFSVEKYSVWDGLPSNEINDIKIHDSYLWLATNRGIASVRHGRIVKPDISPTLFITGISINEEDTVLLPHYVLKPGQNNIRLSYTGISFKDPGNMNYHISSGNDRFQGFQTASTSISFPDLSPGTYNIRISGCNVDGNCITLENAVSFRIRKPLTETTGFLVGMIAAITGIITFILWIIFKSRQNKEKIKREMLQSEQKALRAQMNPHFIFNSLNSIQYFLLENESDNADKYLANFSTLMRRILENSKQNFITLQEELETISLYLELEKLRFEEKFDFKIEVDRHIDTELVSVPPMMLQPYLENAIWHGIMPKGSKGSIFISFVELKDNALQITIEDDGIGRESSARIAAKRKGHRSTAMQNIQERINLLNTAYKTRMEVRITDLTGKTGKPSGTRIELFIPVRTI